MSERVGVIYYDPRHGTCGLRCESIEAAHNAIDQLFEAGDTDQAVICLGEEERRICHRYRGNRGNETPAPFAVVPEVLR